MQTAASRIWTRIAVPISYKDNHYTKSVKCMSVYDTVSMHLPIPFTTGRMWHKVNF